MHEQIRSHITVITDSTEADRRRKQHREQFIEACRAANERVPSEMDLDHWWGMDSAPAVLVSARA